MNADEVVIVIDVFVRDDGRGPKNYAEKSETHCQLVPHQAFRFGAGARR